MNLSDFLTAFNSDPNAKINLRAFKPHGALDSFENKPESISTTITQMQSDKNLQQRLKSLNLNRGIYFVVNSGGNKDEEITKFNAWFVESDELTIEEQHARLDSAPLKPSIRVETRKSVHAYYLCENGCPAASWREIQARLIAYFKGDCKIKNPARVMRLPFFSHVSYVKDGTVARQRVEIKQFDPTIRYTPEQMLAAFPASVASQAAKPGHEPKPLTTWDGVNEELRRRILSHSTCTISNGWAHMKGLCHNGSGNTGIALNLATNAYMCMKGISSQGKQGTGGCSTEQILNALGLTPPVKEIPVAREVSQDPDIDETVAAIIKGAEDDYNDELRNEENSTKGFYTADDLTEQLDEIYAVGFTKGLSTGWNNLDEFYTIKKKR